METYNMAKHLTNEAIEQILTQKIKIYNQNDEGMMMLLVAITKFIEIKQDIVTKDKKERTLSEQYSNKLLKDMVFKGLFKIIDTPTSTRYTYHKEKPIKIYDILENKDAGWIIDNIRDSFAHNHFKIDYENQVIHINNNRPDRKLICDIDFYWLIRFYFVLSTNKIENNCKHFVLEPILYIIPNNYHKKATNFDDIEKLFDDINICMLDITFKDEIDSKTLHEIKMKILKDWNTLSDNQNIIELQRKIKNLIDNNKKYISKINDTNISEDEIRKRVYKRIKENNEFFNLPNNIQKEIIIKSVGLAFYDFDPKGLIETGLDLLMSMEFGFGNSNANKFFLSNPQELITNKYCFKKEKLIALLYIKGVTTFVLYKEMLFDKYIDYNDIDIQGFMCHDYGKFVKCHKQIIEIEKELKSKEKQLEKVYNKHNQLLKSQTSKVISLLDETKKLIINLEHEITNLSENKKQIENIINKSETDQNGTYLTPSNQEFFNHVRNAFAHTWIRFSECDDNCLQDRNVIIEDYNDQGNLVFMASAPYLEWINLFNNDVFETKLKSGIIIK